MKTYNLYEFTNLVKKIAEKHPRINSFMEGVYVLDVDKNIQFPVLCLTFQNVQYGDSVSTLYFNLLYADRLTKEHGNRLQVQTEGVEIIKECINALRNRFDVDITGDITIRTYTGQFADDCAGAAAENISIVMPSNIGACDWLCDIPECDD